MRSSAVVVVVVVGVLAAGACGGDAARRGGGAEGAVSDRRSSTTVGPATSSTATPTSVASTTTVPAVPATDAAVPATTTTTTATTTSTLPTGPVTIAYRLERRTTDEATADFEDVAEATLADGRGWARAAFVFERRGAEAPYLVVLAEGEEVDRLCLPYDTYGKYSCQNGPVVALNADRWRTATPKWTGDPDDYRRMLVNHEVGHLLGLRHPRPQCPRSGEPAPIMNQQSTELDGCLPNPWPLDAEIATAARHDRRLAPGPGE